MRKKIICLILGLACAFGFTGCSLFEHNYERDYQQVIVRIAPVTDTRNGVEVSTEERLIYKSELVNLMNANMQRLVSGGYTVNQAVDYLVEQLTIQQLIYNEAKMLRAAGLIEWTLTDDNEVQKSVYATLDSELKTLKNTIRREQGETVAEEDNSTEEKATTTYPVPETEEPDDAEDTEAWAPDEGRRPGLYGDDKTISLENEAMRRLLELFRENIEADFRLSNSEKQDYYKELNGFVATGKTGKFDQVYLALGHSKTVARLIGESAEQNRLITRLQEYLTDSVAVSYDDVATRFNSALSSQKAQFTADIANYKTAVTGGKEPVLYLANDNYLYVKHILLPFSDAQKAELKKYQDNPAYTKEQKAEKRAQMVNGIVAYPHVEGEDDKSRPMSVQQIFTEVKSTMAQYAATPREADRKFDELIYKYNTDPGAFGNDIGYALAYKLGEGESETYMQEFADAGRAFRDEGYKIGEVYDDMVVTDYGVHIMFYANDTRDIIEEYGRERSLKNPRSVGEKETFYQYYEDELLTALQNAKFTEWQNQRILYYEKLEGVNRVIFTYDDRYKDLKETK